MKLLPVYGMVSQAALFFVPHCHIKLFTFVESCFDKRETGFARRMKTYDKLAPIKDVLDKWLEKLPFMYIPGPEVTVDERLVPFRGCCPLRQYMPNKPGKYGLKIWAACDAKNSFAWNMQIYTRKYTSRVPEKNQGKWVVLDMIKGLQGHNITCDNFFTSYDLGQKLLNKKNHSCVVTAPTKKCPCDVHSPQGCCCEQYRRTRSQILFWITTKTKEVLIPGGARERCASPTRTGKSAPLATHAKNLFARSTL